MQLFLLLILSSFSRMGFAQQTSKEGVSSAPLENRKDSCQPLFEKFCVGLPRGPELMKCLVTHENEATTECKQNIQRMSQFMKRAAGGNLDGFSSLSGGMGFGNPPSPVISYMGLTSPSKEPGSIEQHRVILSAPVYKNEQDTYSASASYGSTRLGGVVTLSNSDTRLAQDFYRFDVGGSFSRKLEGQSNFGVRLSLGSASDQPPVHAKEFTFNINTTYSYPHSENSHIVWFIYISNNNPIINYFPIPGFIYFYRGEKFIGMIGIPLASIQWMPSETWTLAFSAFGPTINTEVAYGYRGFIQGFLGFNWSQQSFLRESRTRDEDRLYFQEKKLFTGIRSPLSAHLNTELQGGYIFDRFIHEGSRLSKKEGGEASLGNSWYAALSLRYTF